MQEVGNVITAQADLLWSVALALLVVEVVLAARFLTKPDKGLDGLSWFLSGFSIVALLCSMFFGYLTYGSVVEMVKVAADADLAATSFEDARFSAFWQFALFAVGLGSFIGLFAFNAKQIGAAIAEGS